jgi:hypothetical protein
VYIIGTNDMLLLAYYMKLGCMGRYTIVVIERVGAEAIHHSCEQMRQKFM